MDRPHAEESSEFILVTEFNDSDVKSFTEQVYGQFYEDPLKPITININSYGGSAHNMLAMIDTMDAIRSLAPEHFYFITAASGKAMSAGAVLLACGDYRFVSPHTRIMLHQLQSGFWGSHPENKSQFVENEALNTQVLELLVNRCGLATTAAKLEGMLAHDLHLSPAEAREFGLIDIVGTPMVKEVKAYELGVLNGEAPEKKPKVSKRKKK